MEQHLSWTTPTIQQSSRACAPVSRQRELYYFVVGKVAEDAEATDIIQKSFVSAYQNLRSFQPGGATPLRNTVSLL